MNESENVFVDVKLGKKGDTDLYLGLINTTPDVQKYEFGYFNRPDISSGFVKIGEILPNQGPILALPLYNYALHLWYIGSTSYEEKVVRLQNQK